MTTQVHRCELVGVLAIGVIIGFIVAVFMVQCLLVETASPTELRTFEEVTGRS